MATDFTSIPQTEGMLSTSTDIFVVLPIATKILGVELTVPLTARIGTINKLTRANTRENTRRYSLGKHAFEPYDVIPGPISTTLSASKIVLYRDSYQFTGKQQLESFGISASSITDITDNAMETNGEFQGLFGFTGGNVLYQQKPIHIEVVNYNHSGKDTGSVANITYYWNCWLDGNPISYDLTNADNVLVVQDVSMTVGRVEVFEPNLKQVLASTASSILPTSISF